ncbi:MAG: hypothetical protein JWM16_3467 [Verrucomicrobiales bacterium]|nr:hypothetical protein [Verrucomicrobiales bacterium]
MQDQHSPGESQNFSRFEKLLVELARGGIDFAVVGGLAVILNGYELRIWLPKI